MAANKDRRNHPAWTLRQTANPKSPLDYWERESEATSIGVFRPTLIPEIMQSDAYAAAVAEQAHILPRSPEQIAAGGDLRRQRAAYLLGKHGPKMQVVIDESALERIIGPGLKENTINSLIYLNTGP